MAASHPWSAYSARRPNSATPSRHSTRPARWNAVQIASGDIVQVDGNVAGASYLVISKDPLSEASETIIETLDRFTMPVRVAAGISLSQRINGQEFAFELVSTDDWQGAVPLTPASPVAIASISQATTTLNVTTAAPHGLKIGEKVSITASATAA
jgi:hypothetical protein